MQRTTLKMVILLVVAGIVFTPAVLADEPEQVHKVYLPVISKTVRIAAPLTLHTTIEAMGVVAFFLADANSPSAVVNYRPAGASAWQAGPVMSRDDEAGEWRASLVHLAPDTNYQVEVHYLNGTGGLLAIATGQARTRPNYPGVGANGRIRNVPAGGSLRAALDQAQPGDTIRLAAGTYYESVVLEESDSGEPGRYITIEPAPGAKVIFDGSENSLNGPADDWIFYAGTDQGDIYYTDLAWGSTDCDKLLPGYVGELVGQTGLEYQLFLSDRSNWTSDFLPAPPGKAFYVCNNAGPGPRQRLYVLTYSGDDPNNRTMYISRRSRAMHLRGTSYLRIRGLEFRYYSDYTLELHYGKNTGASNNIIEDNIFHGSGLAHLRIRGEADRLWATGNLVQNNHFYETGYRDSAWSWNTYYQHGSNATTAITLDYSGRGNVIRGNRIESGHDGIVVKRGSSDVDIYNNTISECMDDGIEVDNTPGQNIRLWRNTINYCYTGLSLQDWNDVSLGPVYIFRNVILGGDDPQGRLDHKGGDQGYGTYTAFKVGSRINAKSFVYIYHNTIWVIRAKSSNGLQDSGGDYFANAVTRNNIWHVSQRPFNLRDATAVINHDFDCDNLHDLDPGDNQLVQWSSSGGPAGNGQYGSLAVFRQYTGQEQHGISDNRTQFNPDLSLKAGSPDIDAGCVITGFNDRGPFVYAGSAPDIGAFEFRP